MMAPPGVTSLSDVSAGGGAEGVLRGAACVAPLLPAGQTVAAAPVGGRGRGVDISTGAGATLRHHVVTFPLVYLRFPCSGARYGDTPSHVAGCTQPTGA